MGRPCTVCTHPARQEIDKLLLSGTPYREIVGQFGISKSALGRHKTEGHIIHSLIKAKEAKEIADADALLEEMLKLHARTLAALDAAEKEGSITLVLKAIREARENLKLIGEMIGELQTQPSVNIALDSDWIQLRTAIVRALEPYPEARMAVVNALPDS